MTLPARYWTSDPGVDLPRGRKFWTTPEMIDHSGREPRPLLRMAEVCRLFGLTTQGMRYLFARAEIDVDRDIEGIFWLTPYARGWSLHSVEQLAVLLIEHQIISGLRFRNAILIIKAYASQYGYDGDFEQLSREAVRDD